MTTPFENFVNIALGKSVSSDVTLPTANEIPVFTGIGRQVTGKTIAELGLASKDTVYIPNSTNPFTLETKTQYMIGDFITTTYGDLYLQLPPLTASTIIEVQLAYNIEQVGHVYITPSGTDLFFGEGTTRDLKDLPIAPGCTVKLFFHSVGLGWVGQANYSDHLKNPKIHPYNATNFGVGHTISSQATSGLSLQIPDANIDLGDPITSLSFGGETGVLTATRVDGTETTVLLTQDHMDKLLNPWGSSAVIPLHVGYTYRPSGSTAIYPPGEIVYLPAATVDAFNFPESVPIRLITGNSIINAGCLHLTPQVGETMYHSAINGSVFTSTYLPIPNNSEVTCYMIGVGKWYVDIRQDQNYLDTDHFTLVDPVDRTKSVVLNVAPIDVGTQRTITVPDADVDLGKLTTTPTYTASTGVLAFPKLDGTAATSLSMGNVSDSAFRIQDNGDATKQIAFEASGIATATTRTVTMPDADINLGKLTNSTVAPSNITVTASPFTYQNTTAFNGDVIISGGTVSDIEFTRDNTTFYTVGFIEGVLRLSPSDRVRVTYTVAPTMTLVPR